MSKFSVIIPAGGTSSRYGTNNKLLEIIKNRTVIEETVGKFLQNDKITEIVIPANIAIKDKLIKLFENNKIIKIISGGNTRQESVYNALQEIKNDFVMIHDGARPLVSYQIISEVINKTQEKKAVSVMTKTTDTIKEVDENGQIIKTIDRSKLYNTQTPQGFKASLIKEAHQKLKGQSFTDDCSMLEYLNIPVYIVSGEYKNIKITTKSDLEFAKIYL